MSKVDERLISYIQEQIIQESIKLEYRLQEYAEDVRQSMLDSFNTFGEWDSVPDVQVIKKAIFNLTRISGGY